MRSNILLSEKPKLELEIQNELINITKSIAIHPIHEPDYIASIVEKLPIKLVDILKNIDKTSKFTVASVFCHQSPKVDFSSTNKPEIGDILFVFCDYDPSSNSTIYNSLLLQAKKVLSASITEVGPQFELYSNWPKFKYWTPKILKGRKVNVLPKTLNAGGKYLLINDTVACPTMYMTAPAINPITGTKSLSEDIADLITFSAGRTFGKKARIYRDGWTKLIWDLIEFSLVTNYNRTTLGHISSPRIVSGMAYMNNEDFSNLSLKDMQSEDILTSVFNNENINTVLECDSNLENMGISTIYIERVCAE